MIPRLIIIMLITVAATIQSHAQRSTLYTSDGNLSSCLINYVYQDSKGYVWIATEYGLNRFDGIHFTTYKNDPEDATSLKGNYVRTMHEDSEGHFRIGCINGLMEYDRAREAFHDIPMMTGDDRVTPHVTSIRQLSNGEIWIGTAGYGIFHYDPDTDTAHWMEKQTRAAGSDFITAIYEDAAHAVWIGTENDGVCRYYPAGGQARIYRSIDGVGSKVTSVISDGTELYVGSLDGGLSAYSPDKDSFHVLSSSGNAVAVKSMAIIDGRLYAGTEGKGVMTVEDGVLQADSPQSTFSDFKNLKVHQIMEDRDGNIWLGLFQRGIALIPGQRHMFNSFGSRFHNNPIGQGCVMAVYVDSHRHLWVSCDNDGVFELDENGSRLRYVPTQSTALCFQEDIHGNIWIGSFTSGLMSLTGSGLSPVKAFRDKKIYGLADDGTGKLYVGTLGDGLYCYDTESGKVSDLSFRRAGRDNSMIGNDFINKLMTGNNGRIWIAHYNGISCYDTLSRRYVRFNDRESLVEGSIGYSLMEDRSGRIWCGTSTGIYIFTSGGELIKRYTSADGLPNDVICGLCEDESHNVWISTYHGMSKYIVADDRFVNYDAGDGLQGNEFSHGAYCTDTQGILYFGGTGGVTTFHPLDISDSSRNYNPVITEFDIFSTPVNVTTMSQGHRVVDTAIAEAHKVLLGHSDNTFTIAFSTFTYDNPEKLVYQYRVIELGKEWLFTSPGQSRVTFNNVAPGKYHFQVKVAGDTSPGAIRELEVQVLPPWYRSWWALFIYAAITALIFLALLHLMRTKNASRREQLERRQAEQLTEAKLQFFTNISHEIRTPMTLIISPLEKLIDNCTDPRLKETYLMIYRNAQRILRLVNQLMDMRKLEKGQMKLHFTETDMVPYIEEAMHSFEYVAAENDIAFTFHHSAPNLSAWIDLNNFDKVLFNILSNAFKYTPKGGHIDITLTEGFDNESAPPLNHYVEIAVSDSGIGIDADQIERIFDRFYRIENEITGAVAGAGIGLHLCRTLVTLHHGTITARNHIGANGCEFIIRVPVGADHLTAEELAATSSARITPDFEMPVKSLTDNTSPQHSRSDITVALVEDDIDVREYLRHELSEKYRVYTYSDGREALEAILADTPDIVISDVMMPGLDGLTLCRKLKQNPNINHLPVILLSAKSENEDRAAGLKAGADSYMAKPVSIEVLISTITGLISNRKLLRAKFSGAQDQEENVIKITMKSQDEVLLNRIMAVINDNIASPDLSVERLAEEVGLSRVHLHRKLKELTNMSARDFIKSLRLRQAARLLREQKLSVTEVAYATGFTNPSHFTVAFKEMFGMPPTRYASAKDTPGCQS